MDKADICNQLFGFYQSPFSPDATNITANAQEIYGDTFLFFEKCDKCDENSSWAHIYNKFMAGLPTNNENFTQKRELLRNQIQDDPDLIYNQMLRTVWPNFDYVKIPQFASFALHPRNFIPVQDTFLDIQSNYEGNITASRDNNNSLWITQNSITLMKSLDNVACFCVVSGTNYIYYINIDGYLGLFNPLTNENVIEIQTRSGAKPMKMISCGILNTALVCNFENIELCRYDFTNRYWVEIGGSGVTYSQVMAIDTAGTTLIVQGSSKCYISYPFGSYLRELPFPHTNFYFCAPTLLLNNNNHLELLATFNSIKVDWL